MSRFSPATLGTNLCCPANTNRCCPCSHTSRSNRARAQGTQARARASGCCFGWSSASLIDLRDGVRESGGPNEPLCTCVPFLARHRRDLLASSKQATSLDWTSCEKWMDLQTNPGLAKTCTIVGGHIPAISPNFPARVTRAILPYVQARPSPRNLPHPHNEERTIVTKDSGHPMAAYCG